MARKDLLGHFESTMGDVVDEVKLIYRVHGDNPYVVEAQLKSMAARFSHRLRDITLSHIAQVQTKEEEAKQPALPL